MHLCELAEQWSASMGDTTVAFADWGETKGKQNGRTKMMC